MKHLLLCIPLFICACFTLRAQQSDTAFAKQWYLVDSLIEKDNLPKSALTVVNKIYANAKQRNLQDHIIKALLYKLYIDGRTNEDDVNTPVASWQKEITTTDNAVQKSVLQALLAQTLQQYYTNNQWRINERSKTSNFKKEDVTTWGKDDFFTTIAALYTNALAHAGALQETPVAHYNAVIIKGNMPQLRPTMYDLLANMAIDFYNDNINNQTKPVNAFTLKDTAALAPAATFAVHNFIATDTASFLFKALQAYQQVIRFHAMNGDTAALIDADVNRIEWVHNNAAFANKDGSYNNALTSITQQYSNHPQAAQAWYLLISQLNEKAQKYKPFADTANRYLLVTVRQMLKERLAAQPTPSEGNSNMQQLLQQIESKELTTRAESVNVPGLPFRVLVQYKNVDTLYYRLLDKKLVDNIHKRNDTTFWQELAKQPSKTLVQALPATTDYRQHSTEIKVDALVAGSYVLLGSNTNNFVDSERLLTQDVIVSHLSYTNKGNDYYVLDRESGKPLQGITAKASIYFYNNTSREYENKTLFEGKTDKQGHFNITAAGLNSAYGNITIKLKDGSDEFESNSNYRDYTGAVNNKQIKTKNYEDVNASLEYYTDRAIYRPGQKVYFKAIALTKDSINQLPKLYLAKDSLRFYLYDVNNKVIDSVKLLLNSYGSAAGSFTLPSHGLTGSFNISAPEISGRQYFRVEEYKRPTFYVQLDTLKSAYKLGDTITVTGFAQAFAGNFLNNASVKYSVQRTMRNIIFNRGFSYTRYPRTNNQAQIAEGTVVSDGSGRFTITFPATPDETADTSTRPSYDFAISTAVTETSGETREANTSLSIGYSSLTVNVDLPTVIEKKAFTTIPANVTNASGKTVDADVHITVYALQQPGRAVRKRYWDRPDMFVMPKDEFVKNFPYDEYDNESDVKTWVKNNAVISDTLSTNGTKPSVYNIKSTTLTQGWYAIEVTTTGKDGSIAKSTTYTEVYDADNNTIPAADDNFTATKKTTLHTGETAALIAGSGFNDVYILQQVSRLSTNQKPVNQPIITLTVSNSKKSIQVPVTDNELGGFGVYYAFVKHNRFYEGSQVFSVPYDNKQLNVQYTTYRNKTEPGSKEQWTIQVKGNDSTNKPAELLTAMYDASLDQFAGHSWGTPTLWPVYNEYNSSWQSGAGFGDVEGGENEKFNYISGFDKIYAKLITNSDDFQRGDVTDVGPMGNVIKTINQVGGQSDAVLAAPHAQLRTIIQAAPPKIVAEEVNDINFKLSNTYYKEGEMYIHAQSIRKEIKEEKRQNVDLPLQLRANFNETAFFFPQLQPDNDGNYTISFTMPESLTKWKWLALAHTKDLAFGTNETTIITQKTLMVQPNMPRFLREGDQLEFTARISNTGDTALTGTAELQLIDAETGNPVDGSFHNVFPNQYFTAEAGQSATVKFPVAIPFNYTKPLTYRIIARATGFNDGEENTLPVLTNRLLVTESLPLYVKGDTTKHFTFDKLLNNNSETLQTQSLTVEYTANPIWNAIQALPYLIEYPYECAEQTFNRFYANALSAHIMQQHPRIKQVFEAWRNDTAALMSNLEKNQELKQVILEETPWVLNAQNEAQQKKNIALLLDMVKMADGAQSALQKLQDMQLPDGGFAWFKGGYVDRYITQYILTGIGRLQQLGAVPQANSSALNTVAAKALTYLDKSISEDYRLLVKNKSNLNTDNLSQTAIQYLFMRSYFSTIAIADKTGYNYYYQQAMKYWQHQSEYMKGMISMALLRSNQQAFVTSKIYPSIAENAVTTKEKGMYWKNAAWGYYWYQAPVEQQALLIELAEGLHKKTDANEMRTWLINQKQTNNWKTTKATADAVHALLLNNSTAVDATRHVTITLGNYTVSSATEKAEAGTGYIKKVVPLSEVTPAMGNVTVTLQTEGGSKSSSPSYGAVYWQYFEDMDKITQATTSLSLHKKLFVENITTSGRVLTPVDADSALHVGNKVIIRVELKTDRDLEYIHLKDLRAASMEPVNVLSEYKWQDGLGYYESTKDVATDFFISYMPKGTYVFEYPVYITHKGTFSAGTATVQCMYAPEFTSHSEGMKIEVE